MYKIQTNISGTRTISVSEEHLNTIKDYALLKDLIDSNGIIDEAVLEKLEIKADTFRMLEKLKLNMRSLLGSEAGKDRRLIDLCLDVVYNSNMKATGLQRLVELFVKWENGSKGEDNGNGEL